MTEMDVDLEGSEMDSLKIDILEIVQAPEMTPESK